MNIYLVIGPIGKKGSITRRKADLLLHDIIEPAVKRMDPTIRVVRPDKVGHPGDINKQVMRMLATVPMVLCDMTGRNANAFYELALRHAVGLPCVHLHPHDESLPFDVATMRAVEYSDDVAQSRERLMEAMEAARASDYVPENPVLDVVHELSMDGVLAERLCQEPWRRGKLDFLTAMRRIFEVQQPNDGSREQLLGSVVEFLKRALATGTVLLSRATASYASDKLDLRQCSAVASSCGVLLFAAGAKPLYISERERIYFDVIAASIDDRESCLQKLSELPDLAVGAMEEGRAAAHAHYFSRSPFRAPA